MGVAKGATLSHISRESSDIERLAQFYEQVLGFERIDNPKYRHKVLWLTLGSSLNLHIIERDPNPNTTPAEGPWSPKAASYGPKDLPRGHHLCFSISNFDSFVQTLKDKGIEVHERPSKMTNPVYFLDPDGNGLEVISADDHEE